MALCGPLSPFLPVLRVLRESCTSQKRTSLLSLRLRVPELALPQNALLYVPVGSIETEVALCEPFYPSFPCFASFTRAALPQKRTSLLSLRLRVPELALPQNALLYVPVGSIETGVALCDTFLLLPFLPVLRVLRESRTSPKIPSPRLRVKSIPIPKKIKLQ